MAASRRARRGREGAGAKDAKDASREDVARWRALRAELMQLKRRSVLHWQAIADLGMALGDDASLSARSKARRWWRKFQAERRAWPNEPPVMALDHLPVPAPRDLVPGRVAYGAGAGWLILLDPFSGRNNAYTVYRISIGGDREARVVGRELPLSSARRVVRSGVARDDQ